MISQRGRRTRNAAGAARTGLVGALRPPQGLSARARKDPGAKRQPGQSCCIGGWRPSRSHAAGTLTPDKTRAMNALEEWAGARRGNAGALQNRRLEEVRQFRVETDQFLIYGRDQYPGRLSSPYGSVDSAPGSVNAGYNRTDFKDSNKPYPAGARQLTLSDLGNHEVTLRDTFLPRPHQSAAARYKFYCPSRRVVPGVSTGWCRVRGMVSDPELGWHTAHGGKPTKEYLQESFTSTSKSRSYVQSSSDMIAVAHFTAASIVVRVSRSLR